MISEKYHNLIKRNVIRLRRFTNRIWFAPFLLLLAILDVLFVVIPTDGLLISSSMVLKKKWMRFGLSVAIGSAVGALILVQAVDHYGLEKILEFYPGVNETNIWKWTLSFFNDYGLLVVFLIGITPFSQQPVLAIAALSDIAFLPMAAAILISRIIKFSIMAYIASHTPRLLNKLWGVKSEMDDVGIKLD